MNFNNNIYIYKNWTMIWCIYRNAMTWHDCHTPSIFDNSRFNTPADYTVTWLFLWPQNVSRLIKDLLQEGHTNPWPSVLCIHAHKSWHVRSMDAPCRPQPGIYTLTWCPPIGYKGLHVGGDHLLWSWKNSWRGSVHACSTSSETSGKLPVGSWGGRWEKVVEGVRWAFLERGGTEDEGCVQWLPSEAHKNLPPLSQPLLPPLFPGLWSPFPALLLLVYVLPLSSH